MKKFFSFVLCAVMLISTVLSFTGCRNTKYVGHWASVKMLYAGYVVEDDPSKLSFYVDIRSDGTATVHAENTVSGYWKTTSDGVNVYSKSGGGGNILAQMVDNSDGTLTWVADRDLQFIVRKDSD